MPRAYKHLSEVERDRMGLLRARKVSLRDIAAALGRNVSTISRELKRNGRWVDSGDYLPHQAQRRAETRMISSHERPRLRQRGLRAFATRMIRSGWSPERVAGRWKNLGYEPISHEAIYQWIYADCRALIPFLVRAHKRRRRHVPIKHSKPHIPSRTPIAQRPEAVNLRQVEGHWEGDTIIGKHSQLAIQVLVERKLRYTRLAKLPAKDAASVRKAIVRILKPFPRPLRQSITYDNGSENVQHMAINRDLGTVSYFCEPMHSWEKGSVENVAGLVRRHLPKGTHFAGVSPRDLRRIESWLNRLPRKCLGYKTPAEALRSSVALAC